MPLPGEAPQEVNELVTALRNWSPADLSHLSVSGGTERILDSRELEDLKALGYVR